MYSFDLIALIIATVPLPLASAVQLIALIEAMAAPLATIISGFPAYAASMARQARWNGQRAILEQALNETFPAGGGLILVETVSVTLQRTHSFFLSELQQNLFVYNAAEAQPPLYLYTMAELLGQYDFQVKVPTGSVVDFDSIRRFVDRFKIAGKRFEVINY